MTAPRIYIARGDAPVTRWCAVQAAHPGGRIVLACGDSLSYGLVLIGTDPGDLACPAYQAAPPVRGERAVEIFAGALREDA